MQLYKMIIPARLVQTRAGFDHFVQLHRNFVLSGKLHVMSQQIFFSCQWTLCMLQSGSNLSEFNAFYLFLDILKATEAEKFCSLH